MKPSERLAAARDYLMEHGWVKNVFVDPRGTGRVCALGALGAIGLETADELLETAYLYQALGVRPQRTKDAFETIADFNDDPSTTLDDVILVYDRAILIAKEAEA